MWFKSKERPTPKPLLVVEKVDRYMVDGRMFGEEAAAIDYAENHERRVSLANELSWAVTSLRLGSRCSGSELYDVITYLETKTSIEETK
jgi:hypothetical protein